MPLPDDEEGVNAMVIYSFVRFDIMKKMYENLTDKKSNH